MNLDVSVLHQSVLSLDSLHVAMDVSVLQHNVLSLDVSVLQKPVLRLDVSVLHQSVLPLDVRSTSACAVSGRGCVSVQKQLVLCMFFWPTAAFVASGHVWHTASETGKGTKTARLELRSRL
jgi:hypothetical protein